MDTNQGARHRRKIRFIAMSDTFGGGEVLTLNLARELSAMADVTISGRPGSPLLAHAADSGLEVRALNLGPKLSRATARQAVLRYPKARRRLLTDGLADLATRDVCVLQYKWEELLWAGTAVSPAMVLWEHGPVPELVARARPTRAMLARAFRRADHVVAWSHPAAASVRALSGREPTLLLAGVNNDAVEWAVAERPRKRLELLNRMPNVDILMCYVGRLTEDKGVGHAIEALTKLPEAGLILAGSGPAREAFERQAVDDGVRDRVCFCGQVAEPIAIIAACDVMMLLSGSPGEGRPLAVIEASSVGTPVIGTATSPALVALEQEGRVQLVHDVTPGRLAPAIREAVAERRGRRVPAHGWSDVARAHEDLLRGSQ